MRNRGRYAVEITQDMEYLHDNNQRLQTQVDNADLLTNSGATRCADGGKIAHGLGRVPTRVNVTMTTSGEFGSVTAKDVNTFTVAIKTHANAAGTTQTVYWEAEVIE